MSVEPRCFCELAPLSALRMLTEAEQQWIQQQIAADPDLAEELAQYQTSVATLPYTAEAQPSSERLSSLKSRLFDRLNLDLPPLEPVQPRLPLSQAIHAEEQVWEAHPDVPGVEIAIFHEDPISREISGLLRAVPGVRYPAHRHASTEEIYMLSGDLRDGETLYGAGDYIRSLPGSCHNPWTEGGCSFFFRTSMDDKFVEATPTPASV